MSHIIRGISLRSQKKFDDAIRDFDTGIDIYLRLVDEDGRNEFSSELAKSYRHRGIAFRRQGRLDNAIADLSRAIDVHVGLTKQHGQTELATELAKCHADRGEILRDQNKLVAAARDFDQCIALRTRLVERDGRIEVANDLAGSHNSRGNAIFERGDVSGALQDFEKTIAIQRSILAREGNRRQRVQLAKNLSLIAWIYATNSDAAIRNGERAIEYANEACQLSDWKAHLAIQTLAAAYAETENFEDAIKWQKSAINIASDQFKNGLRAGLALYESGKPYRDSRPRR
jgi:tetratricopeptide (TPR) repeat protein